MSSNEIQIPYHTPLIKIARAARGLGTTAKALWIAYAMFIVGFAVAGIGNGFHGANPLLKPVVETLELSQWSLLALLTGVVLFITFTLELIEKALFPVIAAAQLGFSDDFLFLPVSCALSAGLDLRRAWSDIAGLSLVDGDKLSLRFKSKGRASLSLSIIPPPQRHLVLFTFDIKCGASVRDSSFETALSQLGEECARAGQSNLVDVWQDSVSRRFCATSFTPLKMDATLWDGHLVVRRLLASREFTATYLGQQSDAALFRVKELALPDTYAPAAKMARSAMKREIECPLPGCGPRLMPALDYFSQQDRDYIVYEYAPGENLRDIVCQSGPVSEQSALAWCAQIADILQLLHGCKPPVVHGNLSPDDLVLREETVYLIDCGTVNRFLTAATGGFFGKRPYAAPEYFQRQQLPASDVYSLGCVLSFLLTGGDPVPLSQSHPAEKSARVSACVDALVAALTEVDSARRPQTAALAAARIRETLAQVQSTAGSTCPS